MPRKNAKRQRSRRWCFTHFWRSPREIYRLRELGTENGELVRYLLIGREQCPRTGRRHIQGYVELRKAVGLRGIKRAFGEYYHKAHFEPAKGDFAANREYCTKEGDFEEFGRPAVTSQGRRSDLEEIRTEIQAGATELDVADRHFAQWVVYRRSFGAYRSLLSPPKHRPQLEVYLLQGKAGLGKTRFVFERCHGHQKPLWISRPSLQWFDGYQGEEDVLIDDFRGQCEYEFLLRVLDIYPLQVPIKGGFVPWNPLRIWITSNLDPESWFPTICDLGPLRRRIRRCVKLDGVFTEDTWNDKKRELEIKLNL